MPAIDAAICLSILDNSRDPLVVLNPDLTCHFINQTAANLFNIDAADSLSRPCHDLIGHLTTTGPEQEAFQSAQESLASGKSIRLIKEMAFYSEIRRLYEITTLPIQDTKERITHIAVTFRDITASHDHMELQELADKIAQAKREWEASMDCIEDFVILVDGQHRIKRLNRPVATFFDLPFVEIIGQDLATLLSAQGMEKELCLLAREEYEYLHRPTGRSYAMRSCSLAVSPDNEQVITFQDISHSKKTTRLLEEKNRETHQALHELKATQSQMLQSEKMATVGQLAAGVAHEINNPTGFVTSNLNSLAKYQAKIGEFLALQDQCLQTCCPAAAEVKAVAEQRRKLKIDFILADIIDLLSESLDGVARVKKIVMNLKNFSRVDQAQRSKAQINSCLEETINIVWHELKYKCTLHKEYGALPAISCFPQQLNQVFMNLLVNAGQAMTEPGIITIRTWSGDDSISIAISDTGGGIAPDNISHVFEPFYTTKEVGKGTGLGLSIVYDIITNNHHGTIAVASEVGTGTTFTMTLPVTLEQDET
ncbi:MAG: ATP-binding protein [Desulfurivibrionaceae bacterium]|nr:ATP-binding protein [Desulfurivibrionaceae bacterium]